MSEPAATTGRWTWEPQEGRTKISRSSPLRPPKETAPTKRPGCEGKYAACFRKRQIGDDGMMAFTNFGVENLIELTKIHKDNPTLLKR
jgi:hypothetical protein